jgi:hypothetical protein
MPTIEAFYIIWHFDKLMKSYFNSGNLSLGEFTSLGLRYDFENAFMNITIFNLSVLRHFLLTCGKHLHDTIISLRGVHETSLTLPLYIEVPVLTQEGKWLSIGVTN